MGLKRRTAVVLALGTAQTLAWGSTYYLPAILASPIAFMIFGSLFGLAPGTFMCIFVASLGDRAGSLKSGVILSAVVTFFGVALFSYVLQIPMPIFTWRGF